MIDPGAHFVFFTLDLSNGHLECLDSPYDNSYFQNVVPEKALKSLFSRILQVATENKFRSLRKFNYNRTNFVQQGRECGFMALLILLLSNFKDLDYLRVFTLKNHSKTVNRFKMMLASLLLDNTFNQSDLLL